MTDTNGLIENMLAVRNTIKVYHWSTTNYARHVATDGFVAKADAIIDRIVETYAARYGRPSGNFSISVSGLSDASALTYMKTTAKWLVEHFPMYVNAVRDTDLLNLRDELLNEVHQSVYLFQFKS